MTNKPNVKFVVSATFEMLDGGPDEKHFLGTADSKPGRSILATNFNWHRTQDQATRFDNHEIALKWLSFVLRRTRCVATKISEAE